MVPTPGEILDSNLGPGSALSIRLEFPQVRSSPPLSRIVSTRKRVRMKAPSKNQVNIHGETRTAAPALQLQGEGAKRSRQRIITQRPPPLSRLSFEAQRLSGQRRSPGVKRKAEPALAIK
ncbi:MAG: hypothetical protein R3C68_08460 [Myxococcota bacterium]